jgi:hypothetical protein
MATVVVSAVVSVVACYAPDYGLCAGCPKATRGQGTKGPAPINPAYRFAHGL